MDYYTKLTLNSDHGRKWGNYSTQDTTHNIIGSMLISSIKRIAAFVDSYYSAPFKITINDDDNYWADWMQTADRNLKGQQVTLEYIGKQSGTVYETLTPFIVDHKPPVDGVFQLLLSLEPPELNNKYPLANEKIDLNNFVDATPEAVGVPFPLAYGLIESPDDDYAGAMKCWLIGNDGTYWYYLASFDECFALDAVWDDGGIGIVIGAGDNERGEEHGVVTWILDGGTGYAAGNLVFAGGGGAGAAGTYTVAGGVIDSITMTSWGTGYTSAPTVSPSDAGNGDADLTADFFTFIKFKWVADENIEDDEAPKFMSAGIHGIEETGAAWAGNPFTVLYHFFERYGIGYDNTSRVAMQTICTAQGYFMAWWLSVETKLKDILSEIGFNYFMRWFIGADTGVNWYEIPDPSDSSVKDFVEEEIYECVDLNSDRHAMKQIINRLRYKFYHVPRHNHFYRDETVTDQDSIDEFEEFPESVEYLMAIGTNAAAHAGIVLALITKFLNYISYVNQKYKILIEYRTYDFYKNKAGVTLGFGSVIKFDHRDVEVSGLKYEVYGIEPDYDKEKIWLYCRSLSG